MLSDHPVAKKRISKASWKRYWTDKEKLEICKFYLLSGNGKLTAATFQMSRNTLNLWRNSQWWKDLVKELKEARTLELSAKLRKIADRAVEETLDRLENGEFFYDQKAGQLRRKPVSALTASKIATDFVDQAEKIETKQEQKATDQKVVDRLEMLADAFKTFAKKTTKIEVIDAQPQLGYESGGQSAVHEKRET